MSALPPDLLAGIADAAALRRLFVALGYDQQERVAYTPRTLDWPANVAVELRGRAFELLADADDGQFQVLLLPPHPEAQGLTAELTRRLYNTLEQRLVEGVLVLPDQQWGAVELVLLADTRPIDQRSTPLGSFLRFSFDPRALRPHQQIALELLDATGAGPGEHAERAVRAFRRAQQERFFRSVNVFSTYYLERRIASDSPAKDRWAAFAGEMPALRAALAGADVPAALTALGWSVLPPLAPGAPARLTANGDEVALLATLPDGHPLDQPVSETNYPQLALLAALEQQKQAAGLVWAVLTNGRQWRLYSAITASISGTFYEVDLGDILAYGADDDLRYFAAFFGAAGLASGFARLVLSSSQTLAKEVGESLKNVVYRSTGRGEADEKVFALLANAIADDLKRQGAYSGDAAQLELIRRTTLVLLYRVLFLLYAESMRLLPTLHRDYYPHSLTFLLSEIAVHPFTPTHLQKPMGPTAYWAWEHLLALCAAVSGGRAVWGVPKYNGGLFSDGAAVGGNENPHRAPHRLLASVRLGAMDLCKALRLLGLDPAALNARSVDEARHLIDYAALDVRRLGSIYEGLLEYRLAEKPDGTLELRHTREERKSSGSYYTPDYIVAYIVEQAVGPVLEERAKRFAAIMERLPAARRELERATANEGNQRVSIQTAKATSDAARTRVADMEHEAVETLLDLKILDPAMGSGHFLVEAVNFVTDRLIVILDRHKECNPILARLAAIKGQIRASLKEQGVDALIGDEQLNNVNLLRRLVMKRCVFGVDLNDMAVELARLSLWLTSFTVGAPLNFLDHHLKWGNSLIGARVQAVQQAMEGKDVGIGTQLDMFTSGSAFKEMLDLAGFIEELVEIADANAQQVEQSETLYQAYEQSVVPVKRLLDLWVSRSFGGKEANELITLYSGKADDVQRLKAALAGATALSHKPHQRALDHARELFQQHRFLHWDLDFPEVFINLREKAWKPAEEAGFDAVVGNPPYISNWELTEFDKDLPSVLEETYQEVATGHWDVYILFVYRAMTLLKLIRSVSFIVPSPFGTEKYATGLRSYILKHSHLVSLTGFGEHAVFEEVSRQYTIFVVSLEQPSLLRTMIIEYENGHFISKGDVEQSDFASLPGSAFRIDLQPLDFVTKKKIDRISLLLGEICHVNPGVVAHSRADSPVKFGKNDTVSKKPANSCWKKYLQGDSMSRYELTWQGDYLNYDDNKQYFHRAKFVELFESPKLMFRGISGESNTLIVHLDKEQYYANHSVVFAVKPILGTPATQPDLVSERDFTDLSLYCLLALAASKLLTRYFANFHKTGTLQGTYSHVYPEHIRQLPIRRIAFTTPAAQRAALLAEATALYERGPLCAVETAAPGPPADRPPARAGEGVAPPQGRAAPL
ncbi:MAG: hypothetical protein HGA45_09025 [Chloroflexales bacterium]|nr:hypothetical protein [Chloroflexales bacterium]